MTPHLRKKITHLPRRNPSHLSKRGAHLRVRCGWGIRSQIIHQSQIQKEASRFKRRLPDSEGGSQIQTGGSQIQTGGSQIQKEAPRFRREAPRFRRRLPDSEGGSPIQTGGSQIQKEAPRFRRRLPDSEGGSPEIQKEAPRFRRRLPDSVGRFPDSDGRLPCSKGDSQILKKQRDSKCTEIQKEPRFRRNPDSG